MGESDQMEHKVGWCLSLVDKVGFQGRTLDTVTDRTVFDACTVGDTAGRVTHNFGEPLGSFTQSCKLTLLSLFTHLDHDGLDLSTYLETFWIGRTSINRSGTDSPVEYGCAFCRTDLDKGRFACFFAENTPITTGKIRLPGNLGLAALTVCTAAEAFLFQFIDLNAFMLTVFGHHDELSLVDLLLDDVIGIDPVLFGDHLAGDSR